LYHSNTGETQRWRRFVIRKSPSLPQEGPLDKRLVDAHGIYRGMLTGKAELQSGYGKIDSWDNFVRDKHILLDGFRPERLPTAEGGDWLLVLEPQTH
jgi:hypothetical protein